MQKSTILNLLTSLSFTFLLVSCGTNTVVKDYKQINNTQSSYEATYFSNPEIDYIYKANITVYGNDLTGIFIAKKINESTHRVVFTTEFGNKLLDFEISENDFKVNSIVNELNKKILINTLKTDFRLLLKKQFQVQEQFTNNTDNVFKSEDKSQFNYLFVSTKDNKLSKIVHASKRKEKISFHLTTENNTFAENIIIQHYTIPLKITLHYFKNPN
jgi:phosphoribosylformylglycinamidine (FGAM) synthase PurS component